MATNDVCEAYANAINIKDFAGVSMFVSIKKTEVKNISQQSSVSA